jgi:hypothetical protein
MVNRVKYIVSVTGLALMLSSCNNGQQSTTGPIVLGDSATIVTESDQQQLKDLVTDLQPVIPPAENKDQDPQTEQTAADTPNTTSGKPAPANQTATPPAKQQPAAAPAPSSGPGLRAEFGEVTVQVSGLNVTQAGKKDLKRASGAVYTLNSGKINGSTLQVSGTVTRVSQRYQTIVILKSNMGELPLEALSVTTGWKQVKGGSNSFPVTGLDARNLEYYDADASDIRNAVQRIAKKRRMNHKKAQALLNSVRNVRSANQKPLTVELRSVMWKIDGKDAQGRTYSKQIRIDIPL